MLGVLLANPLPSSRTTIRGLRPWHLQKQTSNPQANKTRDPKLLPIIDQPIHLQTMRRVFLKDCKACLIPGSKRTAAYNLLRVPQKCLRLGGPSTKYEAHRGVLAKPPGPRRTSGRARMLR